MDRRKSEKENATKYKMWIHKPRNSTTQSLYAMDQPVQNTLEDTDMQSVTLHVKSNASGYQDQFVTPVR